MRWLAWLLPLMIPAPAWAQPVETQAEALADDALEYAAQFGVMPDEALRRLKAQQASVAATASGITVALLPRNFMITRSGCKPAPVSAPLDDLANRMADVRRYYTDSYRFR